VPNRKFPLEAGSSDKKNSCHSLLYASLVSSNLPPCKKSHKIIAALLTGTRLQAKAIINITTQLIDLKVMNTVSISQSVSHSQPSMGRPTTKAEYKLHIFRGDAKLMHQTDTNGTHSMEGQLPLPGLRYKLILRFTA